MTSKLKVNLINDSGDNNIITSDGSGVITSSKFKMGQIVQTVKTDTATVTTNAFADIPGMTVDITPTSTSSKVLITGVVSISVDTTSEPLCAIRMMRDSTAIGISTGASSEQTTALFDTDFGDDANIERAMMHIPLNFLDSPSTTSQITYKLAWSINSGTHYLGRRGIDLNHDAATILTAMEIQG